MLYPVIGLKEVFNVVFKNKPPQHAPNIRIRLVVSAALRPTVRKLSEEYGVSILVIYYEHFATVAYIDQNDSELGATDITYSEYETNYERIKASLERDFVALVTAPDTYGLTRIS